MLTNDEREELVAMWRGAKDHSEKQIKLLAQVFAQPAVTVETILKQEGFTVDREKKKPGRKPGYSPTKAAEKKAAAEKETPAEKKDEKPATPPAPAPDDPNVIPETKPEPKEEKPAPAPIGREEFDAMPAPALMGREEFDAMLEAALQLTRKEEADREAKREAQPLLWSVQEIKAICFDVLAACSFRALAEPKDDSGNFVICAGLVLGELVERLANGGELPEPEEKLTEGTE